MAKRLLISIVFCVIHAVSASAQARIEIVGPLQTIPRDSYRTWSLFLVCTPDWVTTDRSADLANLYRRFQLFGDAIGNDNLAVWFWRRQTTLDDAKLTENVDVARSAEYCRELKLAPSQGPYLVITSAYPDLTSFPRERAVYELGALEPAVLAKLLNSLTDQLLLERKVSAPQPAGTVSTGFWISLLEGARQSMIGFGCRLKIQINTGLLSAELRECS